MEKFEDAPLEDVNESKGSSTGHGTPRGYGMGCGNACGAGHRDRGLSEIYFNVEELGNLDGTG